MINKNRKNNVSQRYFAEIELLNGYAKVKFVDGLVKVNQYKNSWRRLDARKFSRQLNKSQIVIK